MRTPIKSILIVSACLVTAATLSSGFDRTGFAYAPTKPAITVSATLREGSFIHGVPAVDAIRIETKFGQVQIPIEQVTQIAFDENNQGVVVSTSNGDRLVGNLDWPSLDLATAFGQITIPRNQLLKLVAVCNVVAPDRHQIRFLSDDVRPLFVFGNPALWKAEGNEFVCHSGNHRVQDSMMTYKTAFASIDRVLIRGRVLAPHQNFRVSVGPLNMIFNWEVEKQNHFRNDGVPTQTDGHALQPDKTQSIVFEQRGAEAVVLVDDREVYRTKAVLKGTVTVYSAVGGVIAVSEIDIKGKPNPALEVRGPSHVHNY